MRVPASAVGELLAALRAVGDAAPDQRVSLPPAVYTDAAWLELERERIFRQEWVCVGRSDEIPAPGDYFTVDVDSVPLIIVRQPEGGVVALANICLHRMATLATGRGKVRGFSCPYHGWSYELDGTLIRAPRMPGDPCGDARHLRRASVEEIAGFLYVSLHATPEPLAPRVAALWQELAPYHVERMRTVRHQQHVWNTNWKILTENFLEAYHLNVTHPDTLAPLAPARNVAMRPGGAAFEVYAHRMADSVVPLPLDPAIGIQNDDLTPAQRQMAYIGGVFPSHVFSVTWDWVFWLSLQPRGVGQVVVDWGIAAPLRWPQDRDPDPDHPNLYFLDLVDRVNAEDRLRVEAVQRSAASGWGAQGPLHPHEATITGFARYLAARCGD